MFYDPSKRINAGVLSMIALSTFSILLSLHFSQLGRTGMKFVRIGSCETVSPGGVV